MLRFNILLISAICAFFCSGVYAFELDTSDLQPPKIEILHVCKRTNGVVLGYPFEFSGCVAMAASATGVTACDTIGDPGYFGIVSLWPAGVQPYENEGQCLNNHGKGFSYAPTNEPFEVCPNDSFPKHKYEYFDEDGKMWCAKAKPTDCKQFAGVTASIEHVRLGSSACNSLGCEVVTNGAVVCNDSGSCFGDIKVTGGQCAFATDADGFPILDNDLAKDYVPPSTESISPPPFDVSEPTKTQCSGVDCQLSDVVDAVDNTNSETQKTIEELAYYGAEVQIEITEALIATSNHNTEQIIDAIGRGSRSISGSVSHLEQSLSDDGEGEEGGDPEGCPGDSCQRRDIYDNSGARSFFESNYEEGIKTIWNDRMTEIQTSQAFTFIDQFKGNFPNGTIPEWQMCFNLGPMGDFGCQNLTLPSYVWLAIKAFILFGAAILCRALIFGG